MTSHFERPRFFSGELLSADDLAAEQDYHREKRRLHNRLLHGWGVVEGLHISATDMPWTVIAGPGYAIDACGDDIVVPSPQSTTVPTHCRGNTSQMFYLAIRYKETLTKPVPTLETANGGALYTRICEEFEMALLENAPENATILKPSCEQAGTGLWLVLGAITADLEGRITTHDCALRGHLCRDK
jgi:hypothetical protein